MSLFRSRLIALVALALTSCVTTVPLVDRVSTAGALAEGEGVAIGSVVMRMPVGVTSPDRREMLESLRGRTLTLKLRRYEMAFGAPEGGAFGWADYEGEEHAVEFAVDAEQPFVLRGPAGSWAIRELAASAPGVFGETTGCWIDTSARFEIEPGVTTYVGSLVIDVGFRPEEQLVLHRLIEGLDGLPPRHDLPERWLAMSSEVVDEEQATLAAVGWDGGGVRKALMRTLRPRWNYRVTSPDGESVVKGYP